MSVFAQLIKFTAVVLAVLLISGVYANYDIDYVVKYVSTPEVQRLYAPYRSPKTIEPWLVVCARGRGICVASTACPWSGIITDTRGDCLGYENHGACCEVTPARMPVDMFDVYDI